MRLRRLLPDILTRSVLVVLITLLVSGTLALPAAQAQTSPGPVTATEKRHSERFNKLAEELRCLVCQNQTLADSQAGLALDLRNQVEDLIAQGNSDQEIKDYLVQRYGDFVLYRPPIRDSTLVLWFGPFGLLLVGAMIWFVVQRRSRQRRAQAPTPNLSARDRARDLLD
jgi:cytochrome c-type biogenesis protein CcmH